MAPCPSSFSMFFFPTVRATFATTEQRQFNRLY
jgi:hypothetical protein